MKNLDIEKLERKNIYKVPDDFFAEMQMKVLSATVSEKQGKVVKLNWVYSAAAAVALLFGITFFINQNSNAAESQNIAHQTATNNLDTAITSLSNDKPQNKVVESRQIEKNDLTYDLASNQKEGTAENGSVDQKENSSGNQKIMPVSQNADNQVDQILANFSSADIADLATNAEQDVYLDLYN